MEKRYSDFMDEITPDELYDRLIQYGLFADKLPPVFDGSSFLKFCKDPNRPPFSKKNYPYARYDSMRNINVPRPLGIPTPMGHELLCKCLKENWTNLQDFFRTTTKNQTHIVSRIHIRKSEKTNALFQMNYSNWKEDGTPEPDLLMGKRYIVSADISKCFSSIYTHVISWALVGKVTAKNNKNQSNLWYNKIDQFTQKSKYGETHGLLIGPHTSNILSEIILCKIDSELSEHWHYIRNIDDYCCFVSTHDEADQFLIDLDIHLRNYGLSLNHKKTEIKSLPSGMIEQWVHKIQREILLLEKFHNYVDFREIQSFFDFCIDLMQKNKDNAAIIRYGMKALRNYNLTKNAKMYYSKMIVSLSLIYPYIVPLLDECVFVPFNIEPTEIEKYLNLIYNQYLPKNYMEACSFALYYASKYELQINTFNVDEIREKEDCILSLMALIYCRIHKRSDDLKKLKEYAEIIDECEEFEMHWLFTYECLNDNILQENWKNMKKAKVSFLKEEYR